MESRLRSWLVAEWRAFVRRAEARHPEDRRPRVRREMAVVLTAALSLFGAVLSGGFVELAHGPPHGAHLNFFLAAAAIGLVLFARLTGWLAPTKHLLLALITVTCVSLMVLAGPERGHLPTLALVPLAAGLVAGVSGLVVWTPVTAVLFALAQAGRLGPVQLAAQPFLPGPPSAWRVVDLTYVAVLSGLVAFVFHKVQALAIAQAEGLNAELRREIEVRRAAEVRAQAAAKAKGDFLAMMSHEIRTPMNGIFGTAQLLKHEPLTDDGKLHIDVLGRSAEALLTILNDVLDFSKIEADALQLEESSVNLRRLAEDVVRLAASGRKDERVAVQLDVDPAVPEWIRADPARLRQVLFNLVGNAIKFTKRGFVHLTADLHEEGLRLRVADSGVGIDPDLLGRLFQPFEQAETSMSRQFGGTGLGLTITKRLVELMEGTITVSSVPGEGSTFEVRLPLRPATPKRHTSNLSSGTDIMPLSEELRGRVLVVDDNAVNRMVARRLVERLGLEATAAESGEAALALLEEEPFSLVLMDVQMPGMDGLEATRRIKAHAALGHLPVVGLSANALSADRARGLEAGMTDYLAKPLRKESLAAVLEAHLGSGGPTQDV